MSASELDRAIEANDFAGVQRLVEAGENLRHTGDYDATPLANAAAMGRLEIVNYLLDNGADPEFGGYRSVVRIACGLGHYDVCKTLLERGASPDEEDEDGDDCVSMAVFKAQLKILQLLVAHGANLDALDEYINYAAALNSDGSHDEILAYLNSLKSDGR